MELHASAPTRIDLAGGTIDIWPLYLFHEGAQTLNAAISLRAHCTVRARADHRLVIVSEDTGDTVEADSWMRLGDTNRLKLLCRILHFFRADGIELVTRSESPVGAGIAGSSALNIAVCAALAYWTGRRWSDEEMLQVAMNVETQAINVPAGVQDYRPALYGGISAVELGPGGVRRVSLSVDPRELECRIVLAYTGVSRSSGMNNWEITKRHIDGDRQVFDHFERIRDVTAAMRDALIRHDWHGVALQIDAEWETRKRLAPGVTTPRIEKLMDAAKRAGALAAKVCGAGGGGCLACFVEPDRAADVRQALVKAGGQVLDYRIETEGLRIEQR